MTRWRLTLGIIAAVCLMARGLNALYVQNDATVRRYTLNHVTADEGRRMLTELLGSEESRAKIEVLSESSELIVSGSAAAHEIAEQFVLQLNTQPKPRTPEGLEFVLRSYDCRPEKAGHRVASLKSTLGTDARVVFDEGSGQIMIYAPESVQIRAAELMTRSDDDRFETLSGKTLAAGNSLREPAVSALPLTKSAVSRKPPGIRLDSDSQTPNEDRDLILRFRFRHVTSEKARTALVRLMGPRVIEQGFRVSFSRDSQRQIAMTFDDASQSCLLEGHTELVQQFYSLLEQFEDASDQSVDESIRFVGLKKVEPAVLEQALRLWRDASSRSADAFERSDSSGADPSEIFRGNEAHHGSYKPSGRPRIRPVGFQQSADLPTGDQPNPADQDAMSAQDTQGLLRRPSSDVTVEPLPDLDLLILRGRDPDVEELTRIIQEIERLSAETAPEIDVVYLQNVQGEALEELVTEVLQDLTGPLQGRVSITPLIKPNALLLIGWGEAVNAAKKLIARLDESVEPQTQMQLFALKHAAATQVAETVQDFLNNRGGLAPNVTVTADTRTNTLIVNAAPRDLLEVERLVERLDAKTSESVNQAKIITLKNALAVDVSQTITQAITAARGGSGASRNAALEMLMVGPDGNSVVASGLLEDVKLTPDSRTNRIFVTGPPESVGLVEQLIRNLDESPAASAQIKVFQVSNGDATDLIQVLRSLFPEQAATSTVPQLATAEGESSLVPVRFSVDVRTNSIIATGTSGDLRIIEVLLLRLDEADSQERVNTVYRLKNSPALDVANAVNNFLRSERVVSQAAPGRLNPFTQIESEVVVVPEPVGNALIISATPRYFEQILELIEGLDAQPPQVMIQVILAEVELDNLHEFGVELGLQDSLLFDRSLLGSILVPGYDFNNRPLGNANTPQSLATRNNVGGQALSHFSLGRTSEATEFGGLVLSASSENVSVLLRAMDQTRNIEILSRPQIMTLDNQPAFIQVGERVPRIVGTSINQVGQVNSVELENVGLILGVTPRISPEGMVVMEIDAEKSEVGPDIEGIPVSISADGEVIRSPRVKITTAQTTVSSASGQTIVIGGLITTTNSTTARRVPWLSDVPVLGHLFRYDSSVNRRKELLIILTPHVVRGQSDAEHLKQVEMARMSWISCDMFNWMDNGSVITGQLDSSSVPTIFPDQTPSASAMESLSTDGSPEFQKLAPSGQRVTPPPPAPAKVLVPEWKIENIEPSPEPTDLQPDDEESEDSGIQQLSFRGRSRPTAAPVATAVGRETSPSATASEQLTAPGKNVPSENSTERQRDTSRSSKKSDRRNWWSLKAKDPSRKQSDGN
jgi:general secretion pathway protein D